ncbi:MAG: hypothetical protein H8D72_00505 [Planctomycetes bacterium]|nr:hypothetical protein [Planctomycetota bacterium]
MMSSVFTPIDVKKAPRTIKVTTTSQEWCGHTFEQLNQTPSGYHLELRSYFESEGDQDVDLKGIVLEDGLWNLIRLDPTALPTGKLRLLPGAMYRRLRHIEAEPQAVVATLASDPSDAAFQLYSLTYPDLERSLTIRFQQAFPHQIESWEETYVSGFGPSARRLTTRAVANKRMMLDYWNRHDVADLGLRDELGLR